MRIALLGLQMICGLLWTVIALAQDPGEGHSPAPTSAETRSRDEDAIRQLVNAFVDAYNRHDADAIAAVFAADGQIADEEGNSSEGRRAIQAVFARIFDQHPQTRMENRIDSIRFVGPEEAVENGTTTVTHDAATPVEKNRYRAIHIKREGKWQTKSAVDLPEDAWTGEGPLEQLAGLIGDWRNESSEALVLTSYRWTDNHRFILSQFTVQVRGRPAMTGTQRIGWDPLNKTLRTWMFDSEGAFGEGTWTRQGNRWVVKLAGTTRDGRAASHTTLLEFATGDRLFVELTDRVVDGVKVPNTGKLVMVRRPPAPK